MKAFRAPGLHTRLCVTGDGFGHSLALDGGEALIGAGGDHQGEVPREVPIGSAFYYGPAAPAAVPEPSGLALLATALVTLGLMRRRPRM